MNDHLISTLQAGKYFSMPVYLDQDFVLTAPEVALSQELIERLQRWGFEYVYSDGHLTDKVGSDNEKAGESLPGAVLDSHVKDQLLSQQAAEAFKNMADFTEELFTDFVTRSELSVKNVSNRIRDLIEVVKEQRNYIIRITEFQMPEKNFLVVHSVKASIVGLAIGLSLKLPNHRLIELGSAILLHEIGMIRLPPQLYMTDKKLSPEERRAITAHTLLGFKILKANEYPMTVCIAVLESHENLDGTGYPRGLKGDKISLYAKIISVTSSYAAMVSDRPFRPALDGHNTILELLKNKGTRYDDLVLRALIQNLSLFPLGSYVELVNGAKGMVVQVHPQSPKTPSVKLFTSPEGETYLEQPVIDSSREELAIKRPLTVDEARLLKEKTG